MRDIDWSKLSHAYGEASDVPGLIALLASEDSADRENARWALYGNIYHQGTVYSATGPAARLIVELLSVPDLPEREEVIRLLFHLATGWGEEEDLESIRVAVCDGIEPLLKVLAIGDEVERLGVVSVLATCGESALSRLIEHYEREEDPAVRAAVALAIARIDPNLELASKFFAMPPDSHPVPQLARLLSLACLSPEAMEPTELDELAEGISDGSWAQLRSGLDGYWHGEFGSPVGYLSRLEREQLDRLLPALTDHLETPLDAVEALSFVSALLPMLFTRMEDGATLAASDLDDGQRELLESIARTDECWAFGNMMMYLGEHGVGVRSSQDLADFLGIELPEAEVVPPPERAPEPVCVPRKELDPAQLERLSHFAERMDEAGWLEAANWNQVAVSGVTVSPLGFARRFGNEVNLELGYWFVDDEEAVGDEYLRLLVGSKTSSQEFIVIYITPDADDLDAMLEFIIEVAPGVIAVDLGELPRLSPFHLDDGPKASGRPHER